MPPPSLQHTEARVWERNELSLKDKLICSGIAGVLVAETPRAPKRGRPWAVADTPGCICVFRICNPLAINGGVEVIVVRCVVMGGGELRLDSSGQGDAATQAIVAVGEWTGGHGQRRPVMVGHGIGCNVQCGCGPRV